MAAKFASVGLRGFAWWLRQQVTEETMHANKIEDFIELRGSAPTYMDIKKPEIDEYDDAMSGFKAILAHEEKVTEGINKCMTLASFEEDYATKCFLSWFVSEQAEEEAKARHILHTLKMTTDIIQSDREMHKREQIIYKQEPNRFWD
jgi:ferritin